MNICAVNYHIACGRFVPQFKSAKSILTQDQMVITLSFNLSNEVFQVYKMCYSIHKGDVLTSGDLCRSQ